MDRGHIVHTFAPRPPYTRFSEGAFLRLKDGQILYALSRFTGNTGDNAHAEIVAYTSADEGETWQEKGVLFTPADFDAMNVMSVSLLRMGNGDLGLFLIAKPSAAVYQVYLCRSRDEGDSFYSITDCLSGMAQGLYVLNNDRAVRLNSGRIILPLAYHRSNHLPGPDHMDSRATAVFACSDDDGQTWYEAPDTVTMPFTCSRSGLQEPGIIEKADGTLWMWARTDMMAQYESFSHDGGLHWTGAQPSRFTSPLSPMQVKRGSDGSLWAVWNPVPNYVGREISKAGWGRTPLSLAISRDDGTTWSQPLTLENEEGHGYCYPAIFFANDGVLLSYCSGGSQDGACLARTTLRKLSFDVVV